MKTHSASNRFKKKLNKLKVSEASKKYKPKHWHEFHKEWTEEAINAFADKMLVWFRLEKNIWLKDFAVQNMVAPTTLADFVQRSEYFAYAMNICKTIQESKLFKIGVKTKGTMPIFALKNVSAWRDKQDITHTVYNKDEAKKEIAEIFE